ncbi:MULTISPECIES: flagellar basal body P-ring protein FlgI [Arcobacteraceae]|jgi:flagellar P-ring protein precursor FlgI|uniref:flagellar basal body P-ring protein FlgI n=1 Tax=Arcobacteraceae TaxID=2808963 RepID=UPI001D02A641|nr:MULTISPECIES: flagellar basal body P-ring protein FlgI [Arcobacteraceae]MCG3654501.1 flagellar basal body P-ring protein FlgI [Aliarcobacter butzleri]MCG3655546.1 flagellar basal body P-ring protein FlgI [Aliarcobacter butzleri]MCG3668941.1 flagellar basal body P-ring protein FlgI [Aliarcobacter butzleri]MCG3678286.1 flagellar basal body P-ring protein FlgI [Aliarcobacter butzleri]MCG3685019.1 flagellar basal body P-ring protein FlgI [Aliarcobacter butzleri]
MILKYFFIITLLLSSLYSQTIKDISNIIGIRENQLIGYGLIVGLAGTGDKSKFTMQSLQNLLRNSYIKIPAGSINSKNIAAVMVTADLPPFARQGDKIKVNISTIGDAKSVDHGELLITQLKGVDGNVYALAQGTIVANENNKTTGFIYDGATVENEINFDLQSEDSIQLSLLKNSAKNADLIETKINDTFGKKLATALDTRTIDVKKPDGMSIVKFISLVQNIELESSFKKKLIIDMNRESILAGGDIVIDPVTIARDTFTIRINKTGLGEVDWNNPTINTGVDIGDDVRIADKPVIDINNAMINTKNPPTVADLVRSMKVMKLPMKEIIDTLKMIKDMGAIDVDIELRE